MKTPVKLASYSIKWTLETSVQFVIILITKKLTQQQQNMEQFPKFAKHSAHFLLYASAAHKDTEMYFELNLVIGSNFISWEIWIIFI